MIDYKILKGEELISHVKNILVNNSSETLSFYIENFIGTIYLDTFISTSSNNYQRISNNIKLTTQSHSNNDKDFIINSLSKIDNLIDLDFLEYNTNNGSNIDIYSVSHSSSFGKNVIGQAISQTNSAGHWWEIIWKDSDGKSNTSDLNKYTLIHEIGHTLGLSHPNDAPYDSQWDTDDTVMSYNIGKSGIQTWFTDADINALISIWGRENDDGIISYNKDFDQYKFYKSIDNKYSIKTEIGLEDITEINTLKFKDKELNVIVDIKETFDQVTGLNTDSGKMFRLYNAAFARFPDPDGLRYWIRNFSSGVDDERAVSSSFIASVEFKERYGENITNETYVQNLYLNVLNRDLDQEGYDYWVGNLNNGIEQRHEVLLGFSESVENKLLFTEMTGITS